MKLEELGIEISCTNAGLKRLSSMIADGCPRYYMSNNDYNVKKCTNKSIPFKSGCATCWLNYLLKYSKEKE